MRARLPGGDAGRAPARGGDRAVREERPAASPRRGVEIHRPARPDEGRGAARRRAPTPRRWRRSPASDPLAGLDRARIVVVNGVYRPDLSDLAGLDGVTVTALADVLANAPERVGRLFADSDDTALALNSALMQGGVVVDVAKDAQAGAADRDRPPDGSRCAGRGLRARHGRRSAPTPASASSRAIAARTASPIRSTPSPNSSLARRRQLSNGRGCRPRAVPRSTSARSQSTLAADATLDHLVVNAGGALSRWQGFATVAGRGVTLELQRRHHALRQRARRPDAGRAPRRGLVDEPRAVQERRRRQGRGRLPGPHRRRARTPRRPTPR